MMNLVALGLLLSSLAAAGVWSPHPEVKPNHHQPPPREGQPLREGHRLIVVEYERQVPPDAADKPALPVTYQLVEEAKDRIQEAAPVLPNVGQGLSTPLSPPRETKAAAGPAKSMICDAYGVCKEKISGLIGKGKEKTSEKAAEIEESIKHNVKKTGDKAAELKEGAKEAVKDAADKAQHLEETTKDTIKETATKAKDKASQVKEGAKDAMEKVTETTKEAGQDLARNISDMTKKAEQKAEKMATEVQGNLTDILRRAKEVAHDAVAYMWPRETCKTAAAILHLLGFAAAYGTCIWVTFVSSNVLAAELPRQQFGMVQSKLYPVYFRVVAYGVAIAFAAQFFSRDRRGLAERVQGYNLCGALGTVLINMLFLEPKATRVMFARMKVEKEEGRGRDMADVIGEPAVASTPSSAAASKMTTKVASVEQDGVKSEMAQLNRKMKRLNSYSSFINVLTLMSLSWHLVHLAPQMQVSC
ncbi:hypothetical protein Cni_G20620 [Canna indica]|uniref:TMEM205-like domain-containing protein n=1 Tax=Canna indica TaxID=4628 RepID=A0AAQ3QGE5_9LILI|nr:hypothetical protein Cni_G20620 [Canna indica]